MKNKSKNVNSTEESTNFSKRAFIKQAGSIAVASPFIYLAPQMVLADTKNLAQELSPLQPPNEKLLKSKPFFNGAQMVIDTEVYQLGNGFRVYNPRLCRFHSADPLSPFDLGGPNSYFYCYGDPVNLRDPNGKAVFISLLIGALIGALAGASLSTIVEGSRALATKTSFDFKQIGIGAALGFISGGFGTLAIGAKSSVQVGLAIGDAVVSSAASFTMDKLSGSSTKEAAINAGVGAAVGLATFGIVRGVGRLKAFRAITGESRELARWSTMDDLSTIGRQRSASFERETAFFQMSDDFVYSHGATGLTMTPDGFKTAGQLADYLPEGARSVQRFNIEACQGASGGRVFSQGQSLANHLNTRVVAWPGRYERNMSSVSGTVFRPQSPALARITNSLNTVAGNVSKLRIYRRHPSWF